MVAFYAPSDLPNVAIDVRIQNASAVDADCIAFVALYTGEGSIIERLAG
jgi:hypothetical protein